MNKWLVGCGTALAVALLALFGLGYYFWQQGKQIKGSVRQVTRSYVELDQQFPFRPPADGSIDPQRFRQFLEVRRPVAEKIRVALADSKQKGWTDRLRTVFTLVQDLGPTHLAALRAASMSFDEYEYFAREMVTVLRTTAARDSAERDPAIMEIYDATLKFQKSTGNMRIHSDDRRANDLDLGVMTINPAHISIPESNRLALVENKQAVLETVPAYLLDLFLPALRDGMRSDTAAPRRGPAH